MPSHQWFDLTDSGGGYGVTVLSDCKNGSDKPDDRTLRLTLLRTPGIGTGNGKYYSDQATQDWGRHTFTYGLAAHAGDWRAGRTDWEALRLNQPLLAFATASHDGPLGRAFSLVSVSSPRVRMLALKKAEEGDEVVVRLVEMDGRPAGQVRVAFAAPIVAAREMDAQEQPLGAATVSEGTLVADFGPYQPRTFAVTLGTPPATAVPPAFGALTLLCDRTVSTADGATTPEGFVASLDSARDVPGASLPAEMLPATISYAGIEFALSPSTGGAPDAVVPRGQTIALPDGVWDRLYVLAASADGDRPVTFRVGDRTTDVTIQDWGGYIGQWDNRTWRTREEGAPPRTRTVLEYTGLAPGFIKRAPVAWFASHHHDADGRNVPYGYAYLFAYALDVPPGARTLTLPSSDAVRILAVTAARGGGDARPAHPLYDTLAR